MSNYLERDADLIRANLPVGTSVPDNSDDLFLMYAVLMRALGEKTREENVHDVWTAWMSRTEPDHESAVPFVQLDEETKAADRPFLLAIKSASRERESE